MYSKHAQNRLLAYSTPIILIALLLVFAGTVSLAGDKALARMAAETLIRVVLVVGLESDVAKGIVADTCQGGKPASWSVVFQLTSGTFP